MKLKERIAAKSRDIHGTKPVTLAFLGDSVTQGCFECLLNPQTGRMATDYDIKNGYHEKLKQLIQTVFPDVPINLVNAGISGDTAQGGLKRLERDVLAYQPDFCVVCFGLNDCGQFDEGLAPYGDALDQIFAKLHDAGVETVFMTPNMIAPTINRHMHPQLLGEGGPAERIVGKQMKYLAPYLERAREMARKNNVPICDCYEKWHKLHEAGADVSELLSNHLNHPTREMHWLFAVSLFEMIFFD